MVAAFIALAALCLGVVSLWAVNRPPPKPRAVPVEFLDLPGGFEDGVIDETLRVDADAPEVANASPTETVSETLEIAEALETVTELSDQAAEAVPQQFENNVQNSGARGSARGTGRRALGSGKGVGGIPREQRWFIRFDDQVSLDDYAKQLDFFGIELGALLNDGRLIILSKLSQGRATVRTVLKGSDEQRLYMTWQAGERRFADVQLFAKAGFDIPATAPTFQFYPAATEAQLAQLERDFKGRPAAQIRRTYFVVLREGAGYRFQVVRQMMQPTAP